MCHANLSATNFHALLERIDIELADEARSAGCRHCGGVLHRANYPRKPYGVKHFFSHYEQRFSLCCSRDGCRRRHTPASVRFLGRRRYVGVFMVLVSALSGGVTARRGERLRQALAVSRRTLTRWRQWWREGVIATPWYQALCARLPRLREAGALPGALLAAFDGKTRRGRLLQCLVALGPLTVDGPDYLRVDPGPQTLSVLASGALL